MTRKNGKKEEPVFDYAHYSYKDSKAVQKLRVKLQRSAQQIDAADPNLPPEEFDLMVAANEKLVGAIAFDMSQHIVSVPRGWLMANAPEKLDWSKPETLDWVRADRMRILQIAAADARTPESVSGN